MAAECISIRIAYGSDDFLPSALQDRNTQFQSASPTEAMTKPHAQQPGAEEFQSASPTEAMTLSIPGCAVWMEISIRIAYGSDDAALCQSCPTTGISIRIAYGSDDRCKGTRGFGMEDFNPHRLRKR